MSSVAYRNIVMSAILAIVVIFIFGYLISCAWIAGREGFQHYTTVFVVGGILALVTSLMGC